MGGQSTSKDTGEHFFFWFLGSFLVNIFSFYTLFCLFLQWLQRQGISACTASCSAKQQCWDTLNSVDPWTATRRHKTSPAPADRPQLVCLCTTRLERCHFMRPRSVFFVVDVRCLNDLTLKYPDACLPLFTHCPFWKIPIDVLVVWIYLQLSMSLTRFIRTTV